MMWTSFAAIEAERSESYPTSCQEAEANVAESPAEEVKKDPPYKDKSLIEILSKIKIAKLLKNNGIIIIHRHKNQKDEFNTEYKIIDEKKYGISKIIFLTYLI